MINQLKVEQVFLYGILIAFLFPLSMSIPFFRIATWNIPGILLLFWIILRGLNRQRFRIKEFDLWDYSIFGIAIIYLITTLFGEYVFLNIPHLNHYISCLILSIYFRRSGSKLFTPINLILFAFASVGFESVIGLIQQITSSEFGNISMYFGKTPETLELREIRDTEMGRIHGTFGTGNLTGNWINIFIPFVLFSSNNFQNKISWVWKYVVVALSAITIILTISRFNIVLYLGIILFTILQYIKNNFKLKINIKISIPFALFIFITVASSFGTLVVFWEEVTLMEKAVEFRFSDTFEDVSTTGEATSGIAARMEMNKGAIQAFSRSPIIGVGYKNSRWIWPTVDADVQDNWVYQPHNVYMVMLVEGGIFLFIFYSIFTLYPFYKMWLLRKSNDPLIKAFFLSLSACIAIQMIYITFTSPIFAGVYTMILGYGMGYFDDQLERKKKIL